MNMSVHWLTVTRHAQNIHCEPPWKVVNVMDLAFGLTVHQITQLLEE